MPKPVRLLHLFFVSNLFSGELSLCFAIVLSNVFYFSTLQVVLDTLLFFKCTKSGLYPTNILVVWHKTACYSEFRYLHESFNQGK